MRERPPEMLGLMHGWKVSLAHLECIPREDFNVLYNASESCSLGIAYRGAIIVSKAHNFSNQTNLAHKYYIRIGN